MRLRLYYVILLVFVFDLVYAKSNKVFFMTSAKVVIENDIRMVNSVISNGNESELFNVCMIGDKLTVNPSGKAELFEFIREWDQSDILFYIHGYGKEFGQVYERVIAIQETFDLTVVFFYWPYKTQKGKRSTLIQSHRNIEKSMPAFKNFIELAHEIKKSNTDIKETLMAHSLGNYFLKLYASEGWNESEEIIFENVVLNSAAVDDKKHGMWLSELNFQKRTYVLFNKHDFLLKGLQLFTRAKRQLGCKTRRFKIPTVNYIDLSETIGFRFPVRNTHSYFTGEILDKHLSVKHMYFKILRGDEYAELDSIAM